MRLDSLGRGIVNGIEESKIVWAENWTNVPMIWARFWVITFNFIIGNGKDTIQTNTMS